MTSVEYELKLENGRLLGPLDLKRVEQLIRSQKLSGFELARELPQGDWKDINQIPALGEILIRVAAGTRLLQREGILSKEPEPQATQRPSMVTEILPSQTQVLERPPELVVEPVMASTQFEPQTLVAHPNEQMLDQREEKTQVQTRQMERPPQTHVEMESYPAAQAPSTVSEYALEVSHPEVSQEPTIFFQGNRTEGGKPPVTRAGKLKQIGMAGAGLLALVLLGQEYAPQLMSELLGDTAPLSPTVEAPFRPRLPQAAAQPDPQKSAEFLKKGVLVYLQDQISGYRQAAELFQNAISFDTSNVKAIALLASTYLHLIDVSNKDENYFGVISKLIELSRVKALDLPETVIADVELFITINKPEAAEKRVVDFTKGQPAFDLSMFYYLALAYHSRGDHASASRYLSQIPEAKVFSAKVFYLRGQVAENLNDPTSALAEYDKAIRYNAKHARSHLRRADVLFAQGQIKKAEASLNFLVENPRQLNARDLARAYYLHCQLAQAAQHWEIALADIERATRLEKENPDYLLELYTLRAKAGDNVQALQKSARMYYFLGEGEKLRKGGRIQDALSQYLMARQADDRSPLPALKIGDMFRNLGDVANATVNYRIAAERAPNNIEVWSKYIGVLIDTYEWDEAQKAMDRFRQLPVSQSSVDKAAADLYAKQGRHVEAQLFYRKAMSREAIDPGVYIAYAKSLMATQNYKDAPFFFALALRFDPLNIEAVIETARAVAASESLDRAIQVLQDELNKAPGSRAEFLAAIAEFQMQKGEWDLAQTNIKLAMEANTDYATPWKLQAKWILAQEAGKRGSIERALSAYQSYVDRNPSDAEGYLERFHLLIRKLDYDAATDELRKIYAIFPKYPNLHYYQGQLYEAQGNQQAASEEYRLEVKNNPGSVPSMIALGKLLLIKPDLLGAAKEFTRAMQLAPGAAEPRQLAGWTNCLQKNYAAGVALLRSAAQIDRGNGVIFKRLAVCYRDMGDGAAARAAARRYLQMEPDAVDRALFERF